VKCKEKDFPISNYPLEQTEFFYAQKQARDKLADEKNRIFDYSMFHYSVVRLYFDLLHGIKRMDVSLIMALEFAILLGFDGQLQQNSDMEKELFAAAIEQLKQTEMTKLENVLVWLYVKTWGKFGEHVIAEKCLWKFSEEDLETALIGLAYPKKKEKTERVQALTDLIMEKFDQDSMAFVQWSVQIHHEAIETLTVPVAVELETKVNPATVKILKWDLASVYDGSVTNNVFKPSDYCAYARASDVMSTQSSTNFEWTVKLIGRGDFIVGIASQLKPTNKFIFGYDQDSILYFDNWRRIQMGRNKIHENVFRSGDIIHFKFEPSRKKLVIDLNGHYEIDLKDNVNYFPVVQSLGGGEAHLVE